MSITAFFKPTTLKECLALKAELQREGVLLAGGTDVLVHLREGKLHGSHIIDLTGVETLRNIEKQGEAIVMGSGVTFTQVVRDPILSHYTGLVEACRSVGSPQIRNAGTLGGNLANGSPAADSAPPLMALDAVVRIEKPGAVRKVLLSQFYAGKGNTVIEADELLTAVEIPLLKTNSVLSFEKLGLRNALAISRISMALYLELDKGVVSCIRAASGSIGLSPLRETELEDFLRGKTFNSQWIEEGMQFFSENVARRLEGRSSMPYKKEAIKGVFENAALKAWKMARQRALV